MKIEIKITHKDAALIQEFMDDNQTTKGGTHGPLTMTVLAAMLMRDVAMAMRRPLTWEGDHMSQVLIAHGYKVLDW